jgi:uncharacterized membrane protein YfcA
MPLLAIVGAILVGLSLGLLGSGGSILTVPVLVYLVGQDEKLAIAGSLGIVGGISLLGAIPYAVRREISWSSLLFFGLPGIAGTWAGAAVSRYVSGGFQLLLFAGVMLLAAWSMVRPEKSAAAAPERRAPAWVMLDGLLVGALTGLVGVGGGFLIVPALVLLGGLPMRLAVGTSLVLIALKSAAGFVQYLRLLAEEQRSIDWQVFLVFVGVGAVGSLFGEQVGGRMPQAVLRRTFGWMLVVVAAFILWRQLAR